MDKKTVKPSNPFLIPNLQPMTDAVTDYVAMYQGEKGYILTEHSTHHNDIIWGLVYNAARGEAQEAKVKAVRVKEGSLQALFDASDAVYNDETVKRASEGDKLFGSWLDVHYDDCVYYVHTIFFIAEYVAEYVGSEAESAVPATDEIEALKRHIESINGLMADLKELNHQASGRMETLLCREALDKYPFPPLTKVRVQYRRPDFFATRTAVCYLDYPKSSGYGKSYRPAFRKTRPDGSLSNLQEASFTWNQVLSIERYDKK